MPLWQYQWTHSDPRSISKTTHPVYMRTFNTASTTTSPFHPPPILRTRYSKIHLLGLQTTVFRDFDLVEILQHSSPQGAHKSP
jgi:hypothetical protein